jgi:triosephosphate isomerase
LSDKKFGRPLIVVNFKAYLEANGDDALALSKICEKVSSESGVHICVCPPAAELGYVARNVGIPVFSQNVDPRAPGSATGWVTPAMVKACGAAGTLINHSEHKIKPYDVEQCLNLSKGSELVTIVCADNDKISAQLAQLRPDFVAVEPPDLIGGDVSVTKANPLIIENTVDAVRSVSKNVRILCGAGIKTGEDVRAALDLGTDGVLLASGVVKSKDPESALRDLIGKV